MAFRADFYLMVGVYSLEGLPGSSVVKNPPAMQETWVQSLAWEDPLQEGTATHSSILAWRIPWMEELAGYSPVERVGRN